MNEKAKKHLFDIRQAIDLIELFTESTNEFEQYQKDLKTKSAVERQLSILGEAVVRFGQEEKESRLENAKQIVGFRNRLVHAYDNIDDTIVWVILKTYLPTLREEVIEQLSEAE